MGTGSTPEGIRMAKKDEQLKVLLDPDTKKALVSLAERTGDSMGKIVRDCILWRAKMQLDGVPTCSNGRACFVAHMHLIQQPFATPISNPTDVDRQRLVAPALVMNA